MSNEIEHGTGETMTHCKTWVRTGTGTGCNEAESVRSSVRAPGHPAPADGSIGYGFSRTACKVVLTSLTIVEDDGWGLEAGLDVERDDGLNGGPPFNE